MCLSTPPPSSAPEYVDLVEGQKVSFDTQEDRRTGKIGAAPADKVTLRQHEIAWYQLFFQFAGVAEATIQGR